MQRAGKTACREDLRRAHLPAQGRLEHLLMLLRAAQETHFTIADVMHLSAKVGLSASCAEIANQLETLAGHGLLGRLTSTSAETVFDTIPELHSHVIYDDAPAQIIDLHVSPDTLLAIIREALTSRPDRVEIVVRFHAQRTERLNFPRKTVCPLQR